MNYINCDFIEIYDIDDKSICDNIIHWFWKQKDDHQFGETISFYGKSVDKEIKDSVDLSLSITQIQLDEDTSPLFYKIFYSLMMSLKEYVKKYECLQQIDFTINDKFNIQYYKKGQHFKKHHFESSVYTNRKRILTWMIYLNDVNKGGLTVFPYYNLNIKPTKGTVLLWPAEFTHTHFGDIVEEEKYIMTGWINMTNPKIHTNKESDFDLKYFNI